jgi:PAS domain S-box-containing protein
MSSSRALPLKARAFIATVAASGAVIALVAAVGATQWTVSDATACAALIVLITVMELFPIPVRYRTETLNMSMTDSIWAAALLLVRPSVLTLAVAGGAILGHAIRRRPAYKAAFNVGQYLVGIAAAELVYTACGSPGMGTGAAFLAAGAAMAAFFVVNATSVAMVISLVEGESLLAILRAPLVPNLLHWACNTSTGLLAAIVWSHDRQALALLVAPLVLSYFAYRAWVAGVRERDQMRNLYEAGRSLFAPIEAAADYQPFLGLVQRMLGANSVELIVTEDDHLAIHQSGGAVSRTPVVDGGEMKTSLESYLGTKRDVPLQVKVIGGAEDVRGVLVVYRAESLTAKEQSLLDALASQIYVMLENHRLFFETLEQAQLVDVIADTSDGIFVVSPDHRVLSWNPAMERITGLHADEAVGRSTEQLLEIQANGEDSEAEGPLGDAGEAMVLGKDAERKWIRYTRNVIRDRDGGLKAFVVVAHDVTAELEAEQMKRDFVATVSHELRTPLTPLKGFLTTLLRGTGDDSPEERQEYYRIMLNQANRLERLITDLLEVSRIESGKPMVDGRTFELASVVAEQVGDFTRQHPDREIRLRVPEAPVLVQADPFRVGQVVANLVSNALKYSPAEAPVELAITWGGDHAVVSVRDHGDGIPSGEQHRVFERFHRLENGLTRRTGGTGLGLYIAKRLVEAMDGRIWLYSKPGVGSTFSFSLPMVSAEESWLGSRVVRLDLDEEPSAAERRPA